MNLHLVSGEKVRVRPLTNEDNPHESGGQMRILLLHCQRLVAVPITDKNGLHMTVALPGCRRRFQYEDILGVVL